MLKVLHLPVNNMKRLLAFMQERHRIYVRRFVDKLPPPWTKDPILQQYRFTNIRRELDTVTIWIREHIREPYAQHPNLWFMLCLARQINWTPTLQELMDKGAWPTDGWNPRKAREVMRQRKARGDKLYTGAYMLNAHGIDPGDPPDKAHFTCYYTLGKLWKERERVILPALEKKSLQIVAETLTPYHGWGPFTAAQAVADLKHTRYLEDATDWWDWAYLGPGSTRGLNRILNRPVKQHRISPADAIVYLKALRDYVNNNSALGKLCLQDMQSCLCEYDKRERTRLDEGRPRTKFTSGGVQ